MNIRIFLVGITIILLGTNAYLYKYTQDLSEDIAASNTQCEKRLAMLEAKYSHPLSTTVLAQAEPTYANNIAPTQAPKPKVNLDELLSHGHRVQAVTHKYEFLLDTAQIDSDDKKSLRRMLLKREQLANAIAFTEKESGNTSKLETQLSEVEKQIDSVLTDPIDYQRYEYLKARSL